MQRGHRRQARRTAAHAIGPVAAVGDHVESELAVGAFGGEVRLALRRTNPVALHDQHEVVHQAFDGAVRGLLGRQDDALVVRGDALERLAVLTLEIRRQRDRHEQQPLGFALLALIDVGGGVDRAAFEVHVDRAAGNRRQRLLGDAHRLLHLGHAHEVARIVVAVLLRRDLELHAVVRPVRRGATHVVAHADRAQQRSGDRIGDRVLPRERADADHAVHEDAIAGEQAVDLVQHLARLLERGPDLRLESLRQVGPHTTHAAVRDGEPRARDVFDQLPEELARLDHIEEDGERAQLHGRGADAREVIAHARDLRHDRADVLAALGDVDAEELFDGVGVREVVDERRDVVEPVGVGNRVVPAADLAILFERAMQVADLDVGLADDLAIELGHDADDAVHGGMRGPQADGQVLARARAAPLAQHDLAARGLGHAQICGPISGWRRLIG